ncbi:hypothetical protein K3495_g12936 [Podosphaera aphanis]|nr:hypothetical protein K3495_g12936 [Podosphaera aphanis]
MLLDMSHNIVEATRQSKPIDLTESYDPAWVSGKTIVITGGASGFGAGFSRHWASHGAHVIVADIDAAQGNAIVEELRKTSPHSHFVQCDVTNWKSQVALFRAAASLSPHGGIDGVVANAGISGRWQTFQETGDYDRDDPPEPQFKVVDVNLIGVMYTAKLAQFWLPRNPGSEKASPNSTITPGRVHRDRHLLLIGSVASITGLQLHEYGISKHGVLGLFRSMRLTSCLEGIRVNILMPYFIDTPIIPMEGRLMLAGSGLGKPEDVVDAGTRMMADHRIAGRSLVIGPKVRVDEDWQLLSEDSKEGRSTAIWEAFAHDHEEVDAFIARFIGLLNRVETAKGWLGWGVDVIQALLYPLRSWARRGP